MFAKYNGKRLVAYVYPGRVCKFTHSERNIQCTTDIGS